MYVNKRDSNGSALIGQMGEDIFQSTMEKKTHLIIKKANYKQQTQEHWDYSLEGNGKKLTVDVKAMKRVGRWDGKQQSDLIWIEIQSVSEKIKKGWLYGKADVIAFQNEDGFLFVSRRKLANLCEKLVGYDPKTVTVDDCKKTKGLYKLYNRRDRKDILTMIKKEDILGIEHNYLKY